MNLEDIRGKASDDLVAALSDLSEELFKLRYASAAEQVENSRKIRDGRRTVARIKTILREREITSAKESS